MHNYLPKIFCFIDQYNLDELKVINKNTGIIYRNYEKRIDLKTVILIRNYCRKNNRFLYLANNIKASIKLKLDGVYIPSFIKKLNYKNCSIPKNFIFLGSAHNEQELIIKEKQGCALIFVAPIFKVKKKRNYLGINNFNRLSLNNKRKLIALGGINSNNIKKINLLNCFGFAGISWIKKNGLIKIRPLLNCLNKQ